MHYWRHNLVSLSPKVPDGQVYSQEYVAFNPYKSFGNFGHCATHVFVVGSA
jgi:hypothetical protein